MIRKCCALALPVLLLGACKNAESKQMALLAGKYIRTIPEGPDSELHEQALASLRQSYAFKGVELTGELDRHVMTLTADGKFTTEHTSPQLQQFDMPLGEGTYRVLNPTTIVLRYAVEGNPDDERIMDSQKFTVAGDTLFPQSSERMRMAERVTSYSMNVGVKSFLLRQR